MKGEILTLKISEKRTKELLLLSGFLHTTIFLANRSYKVRQDNIACVMFSGFFTTFCIGFDDGIYKRTIEFENVQSLVTKQPIFVTKENSIEKDF